MHLLSALVRAFYRGHAKKPGREKHKTRPKHSRVAVGPLLLFAVSGNKRKIFGAAARKRVGGAATRNGCYRAAVNTSRGQTFSMDGLDQDPSYLLRKCPVLSGGAAAQ